MQHTDFANGRWEKLSLFEQMANIGSEVERAITWRNKGNLEYSHEANSRALELFDLTLADVQNRKRLREIARARELWLDYYLGDNQYQQTAEQWQKYFYNFNYASRVASFRE